MREGEWQRGEAEGELDPQDRQDGDVHHRAVGADAVIEQASVQQHGEADEADDSRNATGGDGDQLLLLDGDEERVEPGRRQQTYRMTQQQEQDADMEQVGAPGELTLSQDLAGAGAPGVLLAVEADQAAEEKDRQADVGIPDEQEMEDVVLHDRTPGLEGAVA
jgi:hypothetical protein